MRRWVIAAVAVLLAGLALTGCSRSTPPSMDQESTDQLATELLTTSWNAARDGDTKALGEALAPSFLLVRADGTGSTYQQLLDRSASLATVLLAGAADLRAGLETRLRSDLGIKVIVELVPAGSLAAYTYGREGKAKRLIDRRSTT